MASNGSPAPSDLGHLLEASSEFASRAGTPSDESAKEFLDKFPLSALFSALQSEVNTPSAVDAVVACLDKIFRTDYGASLLLYNASFIVVGLQAKIEAIRCLACRAVSVLFKNGENDEATQLILDYGIYPLLINCLLDGNEGTSIASIDAIKSIAQSSISIVFPRHVAQSLELYGIATHSSSLGRIRILALIVKLFTASSSLAAAVYNSNLLGLFEAEIKNSQDMLSSLSALELLYELVSSPFGNMFVLKTTLLELLNEMISNSSIDPILRSRALLVAGRLLSSTDDFSTTDESKVTAILLAIDGRLEQLENQSTTDEYELALEALGLIGTTKHGAIFLLTRSSGVAKHVVESAFDRRSRGKQLAALHALGIICGAKRLENGLLIENAESSLKQMIYEKAARSSSIKPSVMLLSLLQQEQEVQIAAYRLIGALVVRHWCLSEICSKPEIISILTDPTKESVKNAMEARDECCVAITNALLVSDLLTDATVAGITTKLQDSVKRGPYGLARRQAEARPIVGTLERF